jgi:translocation protein SEC63
MAASEETSALFPIFILTIMAIPIVPYTITKLCRAASKKSKSIHCQCNDCSRSGKYRKSIFQRVRSISPYLHFSGFKLLHIIDFHL